MWVAVAVVIAWLAATYLYGFYVTYRGRRGVEEWFVAGRRLGVVALCLSLGANIYSSYTFLGLPGLAAREGFRAFSVTLYGMIAYIVGFWLVSELWRKAKDRGWLTFADAFQDLYTSRAMGVFAALAGALWSIPYIQLQLQGMGYIFEALSYGYINRDAATVISFVLLTVLIVAGGMVSVTSINVLQGAIMLVTIWGLALASPIIAFGSFDKLFEVLASGNVPKCLKFRIVPDISEYIYLYTLIAVAPLGFWIWPNRVQNIFAARDEKTIKRNMVLTSIFQIGQIPIILAGLTFLALYVSGRPILPPGYSICSKEVTDQSFILLALALYHPILVGLVGAGTVAASLSTAAAILHSCAAMFSRNIAAAGEEGRLLVVAKLFTVAIAAVSLVLALYAPGALIYLLLAGYAGIVQLFPPLFIALRKPGLVDAPTAISASALGMITAAYFAIRKPIPALYEGFAGLFVNLLVLSLLVYAKKLLKTARKPQ